MPESFKYEYIFCLVCKSRKYLYQNCHVKTNYAESLCRVLSFIST